MIFRDVRLYVHSKYYYTVITNQTLKRKLFVKKKMINCFVNVAEQ